MKLVGISIIIIIVGVFSVIGTDFVMTVKNGKAGWVWQDRNGNAVKEFIKEEDGCVYYVDYRNHETKTCGAYTITKY